MKLSIKFFIVIGILVAIEVYNYYNIKTSNEASDFRVKNQDFNSFSERNKKYKTGAKKRTAAT